MFALLFICLTVQSCIIYNSANADDNICSLHHIKMRKTIVETQYGYSAKGNDERFPNAKLRKEMGCVIPRWPIYRLAIIYRCKTCDSLEKIICKKDK